MSFRNLFRVLAGALILTLSGCGGGGGEEATEVAAVTAKKLSTSLSRGINLAGAAFGATKIPGRNGFDYLWPPATDIAMYADAGFRTIRVSFLWERMQPELFNALNSDELTRLDEVINSAAAKHMTVVLDLHNYGAYRGGLIGSAAVPTSAFQDFWGRIAGRYKDSASVVFGLMNEPHDQSAADWAVIAQSAVDAIRATGAPQLILVPGTNWSGANNWTTRFGTVSNGEALLGLKDPGENFAFEMHQYFDTWSTGTTPSCVSATIGVERLEAATAWLRQNNRKGFLGEFGASTDPVCISALTNTLEYLTINADVWQGWTYWVGARWFGNYMFNIYPPNKATSPQLTAMDKFLK